MWRTPIVKLCLGPLLTQQTLKKVNLWEKTAVEKSARIKACICTGHQAAHEVKFHLKYQSDPFAQKNGLSISTKVLICKKIEDEPAYCTDRNELLQIMETMQKFSLFSKDGANV